MIEVFLKILKKSLLVIKDEPILLIPFILYRLILLIFAQMLNMNEHDLLLSYSLFITIFFEWLILVLFIQPFVLIIALKTIQKKVIELKSVFNSQLKLIMGFFIVSLLSRPIYIFGMKKIMVIKDASSETISVIGVVSFLIGIIMLFLTMFFQPYYISTKSNNLPLIGHILNAMQIVTQFKWVVLSLTIYFALFSILIIQLGFSFIAILVPKEFHLILLCIAGGIQYTLFNIFVLRMYLYFKPLVNLSYK